jgi:hypothetical protein
VTIPKAHITWTATALGGSFGYYSVERYNELLVTSGVSTPGWQRIAKVMSEATVAFDDYEGRYTVAENYRVLVYDNLGGPSVPATSVTLTKTVPANQGFVIVSNEAAAINQTVNVRYPLTVQLPERVAVASVAGRFGQRVHRSTDQIGETASLMLNVAGVNGPELWRTLVTNLRSNLSYVCLLDPWGHRWFAGLLPSQMDLTFFNFGDLAVNMVEVTDTPSIVVV